MSTDFADMNEGQDALEAAWKESEKLRQRIAELEAQLEVERVTNAAHRDQLDMAEIENDLAKEANRDLIAELKAGVKENERLREELLEVTVSAEGYNGMVKDAQRWRYARDHGWLDGSLLLHKASAYEKDAAIDAARDAG